MKYVLKNPKTGAFLCRLCEGETMPDEPGGEPVKLEYIKFDTASEARAYAETRPGYQPYPYDKIPPLN